MSAKTEMKSGGFNININPKLVLQLALTLSSSRADVTTAYITSNPMPSVPTSLFNEQGPMRIWCLEYGVETTGAV